MTVFDIVWSLAGWIADSAVALGAYLVSIVGMQVTILRIGYDIFGVLPIEWRDPVIAGVTALFALRIYSFAKEISINGWKF